MADITYSDIVESTKRVLNWSVISGTFTEVDLLHYISDSYANIQVNYPDITSYTFDIQATPAASTISPAPDLVDKVLLATKAAFKTLFAYGVELTGDAILIRAGSISVDTSKALGGHGINLDVLAKEYDDLIMDLRINGKSSDSVTRGVRIDAYISTTRDVGNKASDSLN